jgi:O-antigen/teichoic acid export membrane protein
MLNLVPGVIATLLFPRIAARREEGGETTCLVTRHVALIMFLLCVASVPLSFGLPLLYGFGFADVPIQLIILLPGVFLLGLESVLVQHFNAIGLPAAIPSFWVATLVVNIVLILMLVPKFGARGAALASSISYAMIFLLVLLHFRFKTGNQIATIFVPRVQELRGLLNMGKSAAPWDQSLDG